MKLQNFWHQLSAGLTKISANILSMRWFRVVGRLRHCIYVTPSNLSSLVRIAEHRNGTSSHTPDYTIAGCA